MGCRLRKPRPPVAQSDPLRVAAKKTLPHAPTCKSVACFGAVSLSSGQFVRMMCPIFNAVTFQRFLMRLLRQQSPERRMIVVLDNARYHQAKLLAAFLPRYAKHLRLLFLPPHSPQLAPIERLWKLSRPLATRNRYFGGSLVFLAKTDGRKRVEL